MKFVAATYGTEGDTRPLAALCRALIDAGHEAVLLADGSTLGAASALGVPSVALAGDIKGVLQPTHAISGVVAAKPGFSSTASALARIANTNAESWLRDIVAQGRGCDAIIVSGLAAFVGLSAAEHLGVKAIGAGIIPITPTATFASPFLPPNRVPSFANRASHHLVNGMLWRAFRKKTNAARAAVCGLQPRHELWTDHPMLYGVSPSLLTGSGHQPNDWPENAHACGQWAVAPPHWSAPKSLTDFLQAGEAPIYIGFGSMTGFDSQKLLNDVIKATDGHRALFYSGWSGVDTTRLPANFLAIDETPHDWLFPRTSLVVHHGGSGTTHSAARAGVPSVVVPFAADQFFWAERLRQTGVAAKALGWKHMDAKQLATRMAFARTDEVVQRARTLGDAMRAETGLFSAVARIEAMMLD